ncbi:YlbF family regulator [Jeotgalibacillus sp. R-1-5s-1]|uniref:YlbF family regulator n=1 Tax=Jeotgalibacillus sp. R-1-5s-1 TaxID=2555897 RepID=UPI00106A2D17|nr:YlbF family regulator [Jeotgalibacillus sp. R-1-5s-1]TFE03605.1 YlbF family regulator [Jeotgalibacillus sp. R-1-5s-1]
MLATMESIQLLDVSDELAEMILKSEEAAHYFHCYQALKSSRESMDKIYKFNSLKELYEEVQRFGRYHPDYSRVMKEIRETKRDMDMDDHVATFRVAENQLQQLLDEVSTIIGKSVSESVKIPTGNAFFDSGCSGGCGTGGGCSCSA